MKIVVWLLVPLFSFAQSHGLREYISNAQSKNKQIEAKEILVEGKNAEIDSAKSAYWPTVDVGGSYNFKSPNYVVSPGQVGNIYIGANMNLYDGGRKDAILKSKNFQYEASLFEKAAFKKSITLDIVRQYYTIKSLSATLSALRERSTELDVQIKRIRKFLLAGLSTQEDIDKLVAVYENNNFTIENTKLLLETSKEKLELISGLSVKELKRNYLKEPKNIQFEYFDVISVMQSNASAIGENANAIIAGYKPQVNLTGKYHASHYDDFVNVQGMDPEANLIDNQGNVGVSVSMRLFDNEKMKSDSEAIRYQKLSLMSKVDHSKKEQKMNYRLAKKSLKTIQAKIKSSKSALKASKSTYSAIRKKYEAGVVDNITYLDALSQKTLAEARYKGAVYDYEIKKSIYYYYAGKDPEEFVR